MANEATLKWSPARPSALVVACSDGRLQEATDAFLFDEFQITRDDRFFGPSASGRIESACADYRRKLPWAPLAELRTRQELDAVDLLGRRRERAADASVLLYRCEVDSAGSLAFVNLDPDSALGSEGSAHLRNRRTR